LILNLNFKPQIIYIYTIMYIIYPYILCYDLSLSFLVSLTQLRFSFLNCWLIDWLVGLFVEFNWNWAVHFVYLNADYRLPITNFLMLFIKIRTTSLLFAPELSTRYSFVLIFQTTSDFCLFSVLASTHTWSHKLSTS